ncbi:type II toxin-antitoxin system death-on-curing family toxin [Nonlabens antarcticus]|uniref:type II toxin-antitoxin system death-on-curing family toxin n=1 Tax=Nonlabens antarcticus TaxID=392714 RepID=UPI0018919191|nr:type II toxin-antitoxin system death-on-curing family toxin [Nonlabens antarcticus]
MIDINEVIDGHSRIVKATGGADGLRDQGALESAISRPFATFDGIDLYTNIYEKAAAILESILINHPFIDGNKRTGWALMRSLLLSEKLQISAQENAKYNFTIQVAEGKLNTDQISAWIRSNSASIDE